MTQIKFILVFLVSHVFLILEAHGISSQTNSISESIQEICDPRISDADKTMYDGDSPYLQTNKNRSKRHAMPKQKSLIIVFDGTGSMSGDLKQLQQATAEIITYFASQKSNPIYNYVLVVFKDEGPIASRYQLNTTNPNELITALNGIATDGGAGGCPENAFEGIKTALRYALPKSYLYLFTDTKPNDPHLYEENLTIIQAKQITVNILMTPGCGTWNSGYEFELYGKLTRATNGGVYNMKKSEVNQLLLAIKNELNEDYTVVNTIISDKAGISKTEISVDGSIYEFTVSLTGSDPHISIIDPSSKTRTDGIKMLSLDEVQILVFPDPVKGIWTIQAQSSSAHVLKMGAVTNLKLEYGFSPFTPSELKGTLLQPIELKENVLSIFISDPALLKKLTKVKLIDSSGVENILQLQMVRNDLYSSDHFKVPVKPFQMYINGIDTNNIVFERVLSSQIETMKASEKPPKIIIEAKKEIIEFSPMNIKCKVKSESIVSISWMFKGTTLKNQIFSGDGELEYSIESTKPSDGGTYSCKVIGFFDEKLENVIIRILQKPNVSIASVHGEDKEYSKAVFQCNVEVSNESYDIKWLDELGNLLQIGGPTYEFVAQRKHHMKQLLCQVKSGEFIVTKYATMIIQYGPNFIKNPNANLIKLNVTYGESKQLDCESDENPKGEVNWAFTNALKSVLDLYNTNKTYTISSPNENDEGSYECIIRNTEGEVRRIYEVKIVAQEIPKTQYTNPVIANETATAQLVCECKNCMPIRNFGWKHKNSTRFDTIVETYGNNFKCILIINDCEESDNDEFECTLENDLGESKTMLSLLVQTPARIDSMTVIIEDQLESEISNKVIVKENQNVTFKCNVGGFPKPSVRWIYDNQQLNSFTNESDYTINVQAPDVGVHTCIAENVMGEMARSFWLNVNIAPTISEDNEFLVAALENEMVSLQCIIDGNPEPQIAWYFDSKLIKSDSKYEISYDQKYLVFRVEMNDAGNYSCTGSNDFGSVSINISMIISGIPRILNRRNERLLRRIGENAEFYCNSTGFPLPDINWIKDNYEVVKGSTLNLDNVTLDQSGLYICNASNEVGTAQEAFLIEVTEPPKITSEFENLTMANDQKKVLKCEATGTPTPHIFWMFNNIDKIGYFEELMLNTSMRSGWYSCNADTSYDITKLSFYFNVVVKPTKSKEFDSIDTDIYMASGSDLELVCPYENFDEIKWTLNDEFINLNSFKQYHNNLTVHNISTVENGEWMCEVMNLAGNQMFKYQVQVLTNPNIVEYSKAFKIYNESSTLELFCAASGKPVPEIFWMKNSTVIAYGDILRIFNLSVSAEGEYKCIAQNSQGKDEKEFEVEIAVAPFIFGNESLIYKLTIGSAFELECNIAGNPVPQYSWHRNGKPMNATGKYLMFPSLTSNDDSDFNCIATNKWGKKELKFELHVESAPRILKLDRGTKNERKLICVVHGNPMPIVEWLKNGKIISTTARMDLDKLFLGLKEKVIQFKDHGRGMKFIGATDDNGQKFPFRSKLTKVNRNTLKLELIFGENYQSYKYKCITFNAHGSDERIIGI